MKSNSIFSHMRTFYQRYLQAQSFIGHKLFLLFFHNGLFYTVMYVIDQPIIRAVMSIVLFSINFYSLKIIFNSIDAHIFCGSRVEESLKERDKKISRLCTLEDKIRVDIGCRNDIKFWAIISFWLFAGFILMMNILFVGRCFLFPGLTVKNVNFFVESGTIFSYYIIILYIFILLRGIILFIKSLLFVTTAVIIIILILVACFAIMCYFITLPYCILAFFVSFYMVYLYKEFLSVKIDSGLFDK